MKIVVTGAAGFIGSAVVAALKARGDEVVPVDPALNRPTVAWTPIKDSERSMWPSWSGADAVIHLGAATGVRRSVAVPSQYIADNVDGALGVLDLCKFLGIPKLVLASTSSVYGAVVGPCSEDMPVKPLSPYAATKVAAEALAHSYHSLYGLDVTVLRYFTVYGPNGRKDMAVARFIDSMLKGKPITINGDGNQSRDFTFIDDIVRGTIAALKPVGFEAVNLGSNAPVKLFNVVRLLEDIIGTTAQVDYAPPDNADVLTTWADIRKARELLGWGPMTTIGVGLYAAVKAAQLEMAAA